MTTAPFHTVPLSSAPRRRRVLLFIAAAVLIALSASAAYLALSTRKATTSAAHAAKLDNAYQRSRFGLTRLMVLEHELLVNQNQSTAERFAPTADRLDGALAEVAADGTATDSATFNALRAKMPELRRELNRLTENAVIDSNFAAASRTVDRLTRLQNQMEISIDSAASQHRTRSLAGLHAARRSETVVFGETLLAAMLGVLLLLAGARIIRYKTSLDEAHALELERLRGAALTDSLTQLPNHRAFHERLDAQLRLGPVALVAVDLDGLKRVNDTAGHQAGDEVIRALADGLRRTVQPEHVPCRIGGDEFAVIIPGGAAIDGFYLAQSLREALRLPVDGAPVVTATAGIAEVDRGGDKDGLIHRADMALIEAKRVHRGALVYSPDLEPALAADLDAAQHHVTTLASALARAVDAKDAYTHSHCETVAELCTLIATRLGMAPDRVAKVRLAGLLHDVGKIGISDAILQKPGPLTDEEFAVMRTHPGLGAHIVSAAELDEEAEWIRHHHERPDGQGYPDGLRGDELPIESRIIMVADAFEAMTADRPYRDARSTSAALEELHRHAGTQFDEECLHALERVLVGRGVVVQLPEPVRLAA